MFKFTPIIHPDIKNVVNDKNLMENIFDCYGSVLNVVFPEIMDKNIQDFKDVFKKYNVQGKIFYAHKCNKSSSLVKRALFNKIGIDVASENELKHALSNGYTGANIEATGPKNKNFIYLGVMQNITFNIDNIEELNQIVEVCKSTNKKEKVKVMVRLNGFKSKETKIVTKQSRFGISINDFDKVLLNIEKNLKYINFVGIAFHLDTVSLNEKVIAIENCIELFEECYERDLNPYIIDIGGGYKVNYIESKKEWNDSISEFKESLLDETKNLTWNNASFGLRQEKGTLRGALNIYNYYDDVVGANFLDAILSTPLTKYQDRKIGDILSENMIELYVEPGKALLDQVGINLSKVTYVKTSLNGDTLVGVDMKKSDLLIGEQEMFVDPVIISRTKEESSAEGVYFIGNLCMENDFIFKHKVFVGKKVFADDIIVFPNTAGYFMDFEQSKTIMQNVAEKLICVKKDGKIKFYKDDTYNPFF